MKKSVISIMAILVLTFGLVACDLFPSLQGIEDTIGAFNQIYDDIDYDNTDLLPGFEDASEDVSGDASADVSKGESIRVYNFTLDDVSTVYEGNTYLFNGTITGTEINPIFDITVSSDHLKIDYNYKISATRSGDEGFYIYTITSLKLNDLSIDSSWVDELQL